MEMTKVSKVILSDMLANWIEGFNDCACCPLYCTDRCKHEGYIDLQQCAGELIQFLESGEDY